jgi:glycosyltransferase involved in cell wall biosynthesis
MVREALVEANARGWRATAVFPERAREQPWVSDLAGEVEVVFLPPHREAVAGLVARKTETILHTHFTAYDLPAALCARGRPDVHTIWHAHSFPAAVPLARLRSRAKYTLARRSVDAIVCVAPHLADELASRGAPARRLLYLPNGIDTARFSPPSAQERTAARAALGFPAGRPVVLHYGWAWHVKGGDLFCAAIAELRRRGLRVTAVTVGAGPEADTDARRFGIEDELVSFPQVEDVQQLLAASDVFALPSRAEGMPFAVLEALAAGVPVVAGDIPGQTLAEELEAYRAVPLEPRALADAIEAQLDTTDEARATARAHVEAERSLRAWAERIHGLYRTVLTRPEGEERAP